MTDIPKKIVWKRESLSTDPYDVTTAITTPSMGLPEKPLVILLSRGPFLNVESNIMAVSRQEIADGLDAICVESNYYISDYVSTPSTRHSYDIAPVVRSKLNKRNIKGSMNFRELISVCQKESITPILRHTAEEIPRGMEHMFFLQAFDILTGLKKALEILEEQEVTPSGIIASGTSYGANLVHICNAMWPGLFTFVADDSSIAAIEYIKTPWKSSININGVHSYFVQDFSRWIDMTEPGLFQCMKMYSGNNGGSAPCPLFFFATDEDRNADAQGKKAFWAGKPDCHVFVANKENSYLNGLYNSGSHADSDRLAIIQKALELAPPSNGRAPAQIPESIRLTTANYLYAVDDPFTGEEAVSIKPLKGD